MNFRQIAINAAKRSGALLKKSFSKRGKRSWKDKAGAQIVLKEDVESEKIIIAEIKKYFPQHSIYSEEIGSETKKSEFCWIIDPLDGTTNYSMGIPWFCNCIALSKNNKVVLGTIYAPFSEQLYIAEDGKGIYLNDVKIKVNKKDLKDSILFLAKGGPENKKWLGKTIINFSAATRTERIYGSLGLELALVSSGQADLVISKGAQPYDYAAGALLVKEAGGKVTDFKGKEWQVSNANLVASNGKIHKQILEVINKNV